MPPVTSNHGIYLTEKEAAKVYKKVFKIPPPPLLTASGEIYTISLKNGLIRPFNTIFCQIEQADPVGTRQYFIVIMM